MLTGAILALVATVHGETTLERKFRAGEKSTYEVRSTLQAERRGGALRTFIPEEIELSYRFTTEVTRLLADGIAEMRYRRPTMTEVLGETFERPPRSRVEKIDLNYTLQVSPINEILDAQEVKPATPPRRSGRWIIDPLTHHQDEESIITPFIGDLYRLSLFIGSLDSSLDFSPKLPLEPITVGGTWKRTIGYSPQRLDGRGRSAVQRIDMVYTYMGEVIVNGRKQQRVRAAAALDTDAAPFVFQVIGVKPEESELKSVLLKLEAQIDFDLDPKTFKTLLAVATSTASIRVVLRGSDDVADFEERLKGRTTMRLVSPDQ
jgi:hypothetical protein